MESKEGEYDVMLSEINTRIIKCTLCPRLTKYIREIGETKTKKHREQNYWARPVPSFGDPKAKLLIIGLAPAAHGGNRTGRIFTGDSSGDWLVKALFETGFANKPTSTSKDDGLILKDAYLTATIKCAPSQNKPNSSEISNCSQYLVSEIKALENTTKIIVTLGKIAFDSYCNIYDIKAKFGHNKIYFVKDDKNENQNKTLISSYHPSRRNTSTGILTWRMWINIFEIARSILDSNNDEIT